MRPAATCTDLAIAAATPALYHGSLPGAPIPTVEREAFARALEQEELKLRKEATDNRSTPWNALEDANIRSKAINRSN